MNPLLSDLLTGTATPEVISFAGRMLGILLIASFCLIITNKWTPRWCHFVAEHAVLLAWVVWGLVCFGFTWEFHSRHKARGWTTDQIDLEYGGNVLGYFGLAIVGAILAVLWKWNPWEGRQNAND